MVCSRRLHGRHALPVPLQDPEQRDGDGRWYYWGASLARDHYTANKYRLRYVGVIYRLRHGCGRNGVSQAIVVKLRYGGYDLTEYGSV